MTIGLMLAPVVVLLLVLAFAARRGDEIIERLRRALPRRRRAPRPVVPPRDLHLVHRTGRLIAAALAVRPPPAGVFVSS